MVHGRRKAKPLPDFIGDARLVIHNASFDVGFLNMEFGKIGRPPLDPSRVVDTLTMARRKHPGAANNLDALCNRYGISNAHRTKHGALLDAELLAEVYLMMTRGQEGLSMVFEDSSGSVALRRDGASLSQLKCISASEADIQAHQQVLEQIQKESSGKCVWLAQSPQ